MSTLSELLRAENSRGLSGRKISAAARLLGFTLNHDTVARYLRGAHGRPEEATLQAFSIVLDIPLAKLRTAASLPAEVTEPYRPPQEANRLNVRQRRAVDQVIRAMIEPPPADRPITDLDARRVRQQTAAKAARRGSAEPPGH